MVWNATGETTQSARARPQRLGHSTACSRHTRLVGGQQPRGEDCWCLKKKGGTGGRALQDVRFGSARSAASFFFCRWTSLSGALHQTGSGQSQVGLGRVFWGVRGCPTFIDRKRSWSVHASGHWGSRRQASSTGRVRAARVWPGGSSLNFFPPSSPEQSRASPTPVPPKHAPPRPTLSSASLSGVCHHPSAISPEQTSPCFDRIHGIGCRPFFSSFQLTPSSLVFFLPPRRFHCLARLIGFPRRGSRDQIFLALFFPSPKNLVPLSGLEIAATVHRPPPP